MANVRPLHVSASKAHPTAVTDSDVIEVGGIQGGSAATTVGIYDDANTTTITIGGGASQTTMTLSKAGQAATFLGSLTVTEGLTVTGTTTTVDTTNLSVSDDLIILRGASSGVASNEAGVAFERGTTSANDALVLWNEANTRFELGLFATANGTIAPTGTLTNFSPLKVEDILLNGTAITADAALTVTATAANLDLTATGANAIDLNTNGSLRWTVDSAGHLVAGADDTYDIGTGAADAPRTIRADTSVIVETGGTSSVTITDGDITFGAGGTISATGATTLTLEGFGTTYGLNAGATALTTTAQTIVEAINELDAGGGAVPSLASVLSTGGNITGGTDLVMTIADVFRGVDAAQGGEVTITGGDSSTSANAGGAITVTGGTPGATGAGGDIGITGGAGGSTSGIGGDVTFTGGTGQTATEHGRVILNSGTTNYPLTASAVVGPALTTTAQTIIEAINELDADIGAQDTWAEVLANGAVSGGISPSLTSGDDLTSVAELDITAGAGTNAVTVTGGLGSGSGAGGAGSLIAGAGGTTGVGGVAALTGGAGGATSGVGGNVLITSGGATTGSNSGVIDLVSGGRSYPMTVAVDGAATAVALATTAQTIIEAINENQGGIAGGSTLQLAYTAGNAIAMTDANGAFDVGVTSGSPAISLDSGSDSNFTATNTLSSTNITNTFSVANTGAVAGNATLVLASTSTNGTATIDIDAEEAITIDSANAGVSIDANGASNFSAADDLTFAATGGGSVIITAQDSFDVDCVDATLDATGVMSLDAAGNSNFSTVNTTASTNVTNTISCGNTGAVAGDASLILAATSTNGTAIIDIDAEEAITIDSANAGVSIQGAAATDLSTSAGTLLISGAALVDIDAGANLDIDVTGTFDMLSSGAFSIDGTGASNVTAATGDLTVDATAGSLNLDGGEADAAAIRIVASNAAGGADIDTGTGGVIVDTTGVISLDATGGGASNFNSGGNLTLAAGGLGGDLALTAPDTISISNPTGGTITITAQTGLILNSSTGGVTIDSGSDSTINVSGNYTGLLDETQTADSGTAGNAYLFTSGIGAAGGGTTAGGVGGAMTIVAGAGGVGSATQLGGVGGDACIRAGAQGATGGAGVGNHGRVCFTSGATEYFLTAATTSAAPALTTAASTIIEAINELQAATAGASEGVEITMTAGAGGITANRFVYTSANNTILHADASADATARSIGVAESAIVAAATGAVKVAGIVSVFFSAGLTAINANEPVFLSETAGEATNVAPTTSASIRQVMGYIKDATAYNNGAGSAHDVILFNGPRFENP